RNREMENTFFVHIEQLHWDSRSRSTRAWKRTRPQWQPPSRCSSHRHTPSVPARSHRSLAYRLVSIIVGRGWVLRQSPAVQAARVCGSFEPAEIEQRRRAMQVGYLGGGNMGQPMAGKLMDAGHSLVVFDISEAAMEPLLLRQARRAVSPRDLGDQCEIVAVSLPTLAAFRAAVLGPD